MGLQEGAVMAVIRHKLEQTLQPQRVEITDISHRHAGHSGTRPEGETHFEVEIVSERFRGLSRVQQHQLVYAALGGTMGNPVHALALKCSCP